MRVHRESKNITEKLLEDQKVTHTLFLRYIEAEQAKTKELEHMLDRMQNIPAYLSDSALPVSTFVSQTTNTPLDRYRKYADHV